MKKILTLIIGLLAFGMIGATVTTTLNSPIDNYLTQTNQTTVTFNCSAISDISLVKNITLFSNTTGLWQETGSPIKTSSGAYASSGSYIVDNVTTETSSGDDVNYNNRDTYIDYVQANTRAIASSESLCVKFNYVNGSNYESCQTIGYLTWGVKTYTNPNKVTVSSVDLTAAAHVYFKDYLAYGMNYTSYNYTNYSSLIYGNNTKWNCYACDETDTCSYGTNKTIGYENIMGKINIIKGGLVSSETININCTNSADFSMINGNYISLGVFLEGNDEAHLTCTYQSPTGDFDSNTTEVWFRTNETEYNITVTTSSLTLNFYNANGTAMTTSGYWTNGTYNLYNFTDVQFVQILRNMSQGIINVMFGYNTSPINYTQTYEFQNDWISATTENMYLLDSIDYKNYIKIVDESGNPISNALVKIAFGIPEEGSSGYLWREMGQRFTGQIGIEGMTSFYVDKNSMLSIRITKDGYAPKTIIGDEFSKESYTSTLPYTVIMYRQDTVVYNGIYINLPAWYNTNSSYLGMSVYAPSRTSITYTTNFRELGGLGNKTITLDEHKSAKFNLTRGTDYDSSGTDDITITIWVDGTYWRTLQIENLIPDESKFNEPAGVDSDKRNGLAFIGLIILVGVLGLLIKGEEEGMGTGAYGKVLFMGGAILLNIVFPMEFKGLLFIVLAYFAFTIIKSYILKE